MIYTISKRLFDILVAGSLLVLLWPMFLAILALIKFGSQGPGLYLGARAGKNNSSFKIMKFRTMVFDAEKLGGYSTACDDPRITPFGKYLRRSKLDELPQLINVLKGDMSLVGPRPQVLYYTDKYVGDEKIILSMRPGITDLASLYFHDMDSTLGNLHVDEKYEQEIEPIKNKLRIEYIRKASFLLDLRILLETFFTIFGIRNVTGLMKSYAF